MNSFHFRRGWKYYASCPLNTILFTVLTCAQRTRELELELIQTQMAQKPMLRAEVGMRVRCANKASAE
jgi:hypothetical protein